MLKSLLGLVTGALGDVQGYLIAGGVALVLGLGAGGYAAHRWDAGMIADMKLADVQAQQKAERLAANAQLQADMTAMDAMLKDAQAQAVIQTRTVTITKEIPSVLTPQVELVACIPVGLVRVLRATATDASAGSLPDATGQSDDQCADITAAALAGWFAEFNGASEANSQQLTDLQGWVRAQ